MEPDIATARRGLEVERDRLVAACAGAPPASRPALDEAIEAVTRAIAALERLSAPVKIADRIVALAPAGDTFRTKIKVKPPEPPVEPTLARAVTPPGPAGDDFARIRGIDADLAARLRAAGVADFAAIAAWTPDEVRRVGAALGLGRQISRQNWIEQAAMLARPAAVVPPAVAARVPAAQVPAPAPAAGPEPIVPAAPAPAPRPPDRLDLIAGIDAELAGRLAAFGVAHWETIARWRREDVARLCASLGGPVAIARQNWIEQAALLASGRLSHHAARMLAGDFAALVAAPSPEPLPVPRFTAWSTPPQPPVPSEPVAAAPAPATATPPPARPAARVVPAFAVTPEMVAQILSPVPPPRPSLAPAAAVAPSAEPPPQPTPPLAPAQAAVAPAPSSVAAVARPVAEPVRRPDRELHVEDEEFPELHVAEADVMIVRATPKPARAGPPAERKVAGARSLLTRLKRASPLDDIEAANYAGYRDRVEEASVEIVKPDKRSAPPAAAASSPASAKDRS